MPCMLNGIGLLSNILNEYIADQECVSPWPGWNEVVVSYLLLAPAGAPKEIFSTLNSAEG